MSTIDEDVIAACTGGTPLSFKVYPQAAPKDAAKPFVVYRRQTTPLMTIHGYAGISSHEIVFECWASKASDATATATALQTRIDATATLVKERIAAPENDYAPDTDEFVEPIAYRFWK